MAMQPSKNSAAPSPQVVGNAFVKQYYHILLTSPELVYRFYQDSSLLSRQDTGGIMTTVTTMQGINEKILSLNFKDYTAEIKTADAQKSYKDGVTVLVTGSLMGKDNLKRKFAESFFLAPQDNGYFVLNDVFRFVEDDEPLENHTVDNIDNTPTVPLKHDTEPSRVLDPSAPDPTLLVVEQDKVAEKSNELVDSGEHLIYEKEKSPMSIGGHQAVMERKRTSTRATETPHAVGSGTRKFSSWRAGFQGDNFRGHGRNEFRNQQTDGSQSKAKEKID